MILRNLRMRGLVDEGTSAEHILPVYTISIEALAHLGFSSVSELPDYESLHEHEHLDAVVLESHNT